MDNNNNEVVDSVVLEQGDKSKVVAGVLGIILGGFGIHNFYLGYTKKGIIQLILGVCGIFTCGMTSVVSEIWGLIEGIMILTGNINVDGSNKLLKQ
jgi:TM2 domain-containing membrane protein YozV